MHSGRVDEYDLAIAASDDSLYAMSCGLRLVRNRSDLFADKSIEQGRLTGIRTSDKADVAAAKFRLFHCLKGSKGKT